MPSILIVDDEPGIVTSLVTAFEAQGYHAQGAASAAEALAILDRTPFEVLLTDLRMAGMDGLALMEVVQTTYPTMVIILMTGAATVESAVQALKGGAADYLLKPFGLPEIFHVVQRSLDQYRLRREVVELSQLNRRLQELDQLKSNLLSAVSHEFRTPLTIMHGWLDLLLKGQFGPVPPEQRESLAAVRKSATRLGCLIANLLAFVECERGEGIRTVGLVSLGDLVRDAASELTPECGERRILLSMEVDPGLRAVRGDSERLRLLFFDLMENAVKFNASGGSVRVTAREAAGWAEVCIANSHGTIPHDGVERLLQPFTQGDMGTSRPARGLGLGLAVARAIVEAHGGALRLESGESLGTTVRVRLPLADGTA
jgi:signal transduction histidine kinase